MRQNERALRLLGLAVRAGRVSIGVPLICEALKKSAPGKGVRLVLLAADASANTEKRIRDRTAFYGVPCHVLAADSEQLALAAGKKGAAVAAVSVNDTGLAEAILKALEDNC